MRQKILSTFPLLVALLDFPRYEGFLDCRLYPRCSLVFCRFAGLMKRTFAMQAVSMLLFLRNARYGYLDTLCGAASMHVMSVLQELLLILSVHGYLRLALVESCFYACFSLSLYHFYLSLQMSDGKDGAEEVSRLPSLDVYLVRFDDDALVSLLGHCQVDGCSFPSFHGIVFCIPRAPYCIVTGFMVLSGVYIRSSVF